MTFGSDPTLTTAEVMIEPSVWFSEIIVGLVSQIVILSFVVFLIFIYVFSMLSCCCSMCCETPPMNINRCSWPVENLGATYIINSGITIADTHQVEPQREPPPSYDELEYISETVSEDIYPDCPPPYADPSAPHNTPPKQEAKAGTAVMHEAGGLGRQKKGLSKTIHRARDAPEGSGESSETVPESMRAVGLPKDGAQRQSQTNSQRKVTHV